MATDQQVDLLRNSLNEAQATVRAYDTKAQIMGVGYIFALGIVFRFGETLGGTQETGLGFVIGAWLIVVLPILLFGYVLYPTRKTAPGANAQSGVGAKRILYVNPDDHDGAAHLLEDLQDAEPVAEIAHELLVVSRLREMKRRRFLRALFGAGMSFVILFLAQAARGLALTQPG